MSNKGIGAAPARLARDEQALQRFEHSGATPTGVVSLLAKRGGRAYYRIEMAHGPTCYAAGPAVRGDYTFGKIMCAGDFPSPERPLLDFTVTHGTLRNGTVSDRRVASSEGVVADGVARVGFRSPSGEIVAAAAAKDNVYQGIPPPGTVTELVALASDGKVLYSQALR